MKNDVNDATTATENKKNFLKSHGEITDLIKGSEDLKQENVKMIIDYKNSQGTNSLVLVGKEENALEYNSLHNSPSYREVRIIGDRTMDNFLKTEDPTVIEPMVYGSVTFDSNCFGTLKAKAVKVQERIIAEVVAKNNVKQENIKMILGYRNSKETNFLVSVDVEEEAYWADKFSFENLAPGITVKTISESTLDNFLEKEDPTVVKVIKNGFTVFVSNKDYLHKLWRRIVETKEEAELMPA